MPNFLLPSFPTSSAFVNLKLLKGTSQRKTCMLLLPHVIFHRIHLCVLMGVMLLCITHFIDVHKSLLSKNVLLFKCRIWIYVNHFPITSCEFWQPQTKTVLRMTSVCFYYSHRNLLVSNLNACYFWFLELCYISLGLPPSLYNSYTSLYMDKWQSTQ